MTTTDKKWYGGGYIYGVQVKAPGGNPPGILLPGQFATVQEAMVDFALGTKELRGIYEDPEDVATASRKITGKITVGRVNLSQLNNFVFGETIATGSLALAQQEPQTIPVSAGPYTIEVDHAAEFYQDLGVQYAGTRISLTPVTSMPAEGEYTYDASTGVYTFNAADQLEEVLISYRYSTATGSNLVVNNLVMGSSRPVFEALFQNPYEGDNELLLYSCRATKIGFPVKTEDYVKMDIEFIAFANDVGKIFQLLQSA